jgi:hypothetical protein
MSTAELEALRNAPLRLLVVGSPEWADEIRIQFEAKGETRLVATAIDETPWYKLTPPDLAEYDVLICPPDRVSALALQGHLLRLTPGQLEKWNHADWLPLDRRVGRLDQEVYGVSLGGPLGSVVYHPQRFSDAGRTGGEADESNGAGEAMPTTWTQWQAAVTRDLERGVSGQWLEPLSGTGAAEAVLLRVAALTKGPAQTDVFISRIDGQPRLTSPPFLKAVEDLKATYGSDLATLRELTAAEAVRRVGAGEAKAALVPLPRMDDVNAGPSPLIPAPPLGSHRYYDHFDGAWSTRAGGEAVATQWLSATGRVAVVLRKTRKSEAALRLIELLSTSPTAESFTEFRPHVPAFRREHLTNLSHWAGRQYSAEAIKSIEEVFTLAGDEVKGGAAGLPPLPGNEERLAALNVAVWQVLDGQQEAAAALGDCQQTWLEIAARHGLELQKTILNRNR